MLQEHLLPGYCDAILRAVLFRYLRMWRELSKKFSDVFLDVSYLPLITSMAEDKPPRIVPPKRKSPPSLKYICPL